MAPIGYARVGTAYQNLDCQVETIGEANKLFIDKASGKILIVHSSMPCARTYMKARMTSFG